MKSIGRSNVSANVRFRPIADISCSRHTDWMLRIITIAGFLVTMGCSAAHEAPKSLCDLPRSLATWQNTPVRWQGILLDATPHGLTLIADDCRRRGINIKEWSENPSHEAALNQVTRRGWRESGIIRVDLSGRITQDGQLAVSDVHRIQFEPMTDQQETTFWRSIGF